MEYATEPKQRTLRRKRTQPKIPLDDEDLPISRHFLSPDNQIFQFLESSNQPNSDRTHFHASKHVQNMNEYNNPPDGLPIIIREKDLALRQKTMKHFLALNDFGGVSQNFEKKQSHHKIGKKAPLEFINNIASIANQNYSRKKNQGKMLVNELWGRKYHKKILFATGLRTAEYRIKAKSLQVATERVKAVGKYYEAKHKDQIKKEREFLELLVIPVENTESNDELRVMLNTKQSSLRRASVIFGLNAMRKNSGIESPSRRGSFSASPTKQSPENKTSPSKKSLFARNETFATLAASIGIKNESSPQPQQQNYDSGLFSERRENNVSDADSSVSGFRPITEGTTLQTLSTCGSPHLASESLFVSTKGFKLSKIREEKEFETESPLLKTIRAGLFEKKALAVPKAYNHKPKPEMAKEITKLVPSRSLSKESKGTIHPQEPMKFIKRKPKLHVNTTNDLETSNTRPHTVTGKVSSGTRPASSLDGKQLRKQSDRHFKSSNLTLRHNSSTPDLESSDQHKFPMGTSTIYSQRQEDPRLTSPVSSAYGLTRIHTASSAGVVKTVEIERLKKNFLNLMFYCQEVRDDQEIKDSMRETQQTAREMFKTQREKNIKGGKQTKEKLEKVITKFFTQNKYNSPKDYIDLENYANNPKRIFIE